MSEQDLVYTQTEEFQHRVLICLANIPEGSWVSYGELGQQAGFERRARHVAKLLKNLPEDTKLPWHRVVGAGGVIKLPADTPSGRTQRERLASEGWLISPSGRLR